jgi:hypothetical protein
MSSLTKTIFQEVNTMSKNKKKLFNTVVGLAVAGLCFGAVSAYATVDGNQPGAGVSAETGINPIHEKIKLAVQDKRLEDVARFGIDTTDMSDDQIAAALERHYSEELSEYAALWGVDAKGKTDDQIYEAVSSAKVDQKDNQKRVPLGR